LETGYILERDIDRVIAEMRSREELPDYPCLVPFEEACSQLNLSRRQVYELVEAAGAKLIKKPGVKEDGRGCERTYLHESFVADLKTERGRRPAGDLVTVKEAAKVLGVSKRAAYHLVDKGRFRHIIRARIMSKHTRVVRDREGEESTVSFQAFRSHILIPRSELANAAADHAGAPDRSVFNGPGHKGQPPPRPVPAGSVPVQAAAAHATQGRAEVGEPLPVQPYPVTVCNPDGRPVYFIDRVAVETSKEKATPGKKAGRPMSEETEALYQFCYEHRSEKRAVVMVKANTKFGKKVVKREEHVILYVRRYAKRHNLPL
jgi:hypothetical protein